MSAHIGPGAGERGAQWTDALASRFHAAYERLAPEFGYETRTESAVAWEDVPEANRLLMRAVMADLFDAKAATDKDNEGYWWTTFDLRGYPLFALRPDEHLTVLYGGPEVGRARP